MWADQNGVTKRANWTNSSTSRKRQMALLKRHTQTNQHKQHQSWTNNKIFNQIQFCSTWRNKTKNKTRKNNNQVFQNDPEYGITEKLNVFYTTRIANKIPFKLKFEIAKFFVIQNKFWIVSFNGKTLVATFQIPTKITITNKN